MDNAVYSNADDFGNPPAYCDSAVNPSAPPAGVLQDQKGGVTYVSNVQPGQPQPQVIIIQQQPATVIVHSYERFTGATALACFVFWFCGVLLGFIAWVLARTANEHSCRGDKESARKLRNASIGVSIAGIVVGITVIIVVIVVVCTNDSYNYYG